ncbi:Sapep family Mn(2+)-dependent dipeptidase [Bacillus horti]|uniref:Succinyl-diaminopimelate desuccinylase n=1 Tax=Caldalkalibacillus horti TaxID=77523 RepID=A0ABT9W3Z6_9BACI|nr:Sapep family Mn(2+)-dependent dipeptidase [Bacillus horti]MDQ0167966.1 succinyl-diaminopimelate desuccinylase [Bacillus horti]
MKFRVSEEQYRQCIESLQELIRIPSVKAAPTEGNPFGEQIGKALDFFLGHAKQLGFTVRDIDRYVGIVEMGEGDEELGILVHIDVVPEGDHSAWRFAPYSAEIHDGSIWGRGTLDDKGPAMAVLYAMKLLADQNIQWNKRVRLIIGTDEESSWQDIAYYKQKEKPPTIAFTPDGCFPVTNSEKGILTLGYEKQREQASIASIVKEVQAGERHNVTPGVAKAVIQLSHESSIEAFKSTDQISIELQSDGRILITAKGVAGRTSDPNVETNAIHILLTYLKQCLPKNDGFREVIDFYKTYVQDSNGAGHDCQLSDEISGELTLAPCVLEWNSFRVNLVSNIRYPSSLQLEEILDRVRGKLASSSFTWSVVEHKAPIFVPKDDPFITKLMHVYTSYFNRQDEPLSISGGTYARAFPNTVAFGALIPGKPLNAHEANEHVELKVVQDWIQIYANAIYALVAKIE